MKPLRWSVTATGAAQDAAAPWEGGAGPPPPVQESAPAPAVRPSDARVVHVPVAELTQVFAQVTLRVGPGAAHVGHAADFAVPR